MRKLLLVLGFLIFSLPMLGQSAFYQLPNPVSNTNVLFCPVPSGGNPCPSPSSVFSDQALTLPVANPFPIGSGGSGGWWLSPGQYTVILSAPYNQQFIINLAGSGGGLGASVTFNNSGTGGASPQVYNGSAAKTISRNTLGAAASNASTTVNGQVCALGSTCTVPAVTGSGAAKQVGVWDSISDLIGDANFTWDSTIQQLNVQGLTNTGQATLTVENTGNASQPSQGVIVTTTLSDSTGTPNAHFGTGIQVLAAANGTSNFTGTGLNSPAVGIFTQSTSASSGTTQEIDGLQIGSNIKNAGTLVNNYGLRVFPQQTVGTNNFGIEIDDQGTGAADYALKILGGQNDLGPQLSTAGGGVGFATTGGALIDRCNDATGTTLNKFVIKSATAGCVTKALTSTKQGILGTAVAGKGTAPGTTGSTSICNNENCLVVMDNTSVIGDYCIPSTTVGGDCHDTGSTTPTPGVDNFLVLSVATAGNAAKYEINTPDWFAAQTTAKVYTLDVNGTPLTAGDTVNLNSTTPAAGANTLNLPFTTSKAGTTDSVAVNVSTSGTGSTFVLTASPTMTNPTVGTQTTTDNSTLAASTAYVTTAVANAVAGVNPAVAVQAATTAAGDTSSFTYLNGVSGIGATLTGPTANVAVTIDGFTFTAIGQRLLVKNDTQSPSGAFNGIYFLSTLQAPAIKPVFTRSLDFDQSSDINNTGAIPVINGTVNGTTQWVVTSSVTTVGTDPVTFAQFTSNPANNLTAAANLTSGNLVQAAGNNRTTSDSGVATANVVTAASAATGAKQICTASGATKTCSYIDFPDAKMIPAANCNNTTAGAGWSIGSGGTVTCRAGTNNLGGYVSITDTSSTFATFQIAIPEDWDTASNPYIRFQLASTDATNAHTIIPSIQVACYKGDGSTTDDVAANAAHSLSTTTLNGNANRFWSTSNVQMNSTDVTGCVAGALMQVTVGRATDTATNAEFYSTTITFPRLLVVQAN